MPAYFRARVSELLNLSPTEIVGMLQTAYANDGFSSQYTKQTKAWAWIVAKLQHHLANVVQHRCDAGDWSVLLEYPLYRLRRRIDLVILAGELIVVVECKVGAETFRSEDLRQVEEYALDLRDFHAESRSRFILPILWSTEAHSGSDCFEVSTQASIGDGTVAPVVRIGRDGFSSLFVALPPPLGRGISPEQWDLSTYRPVPNVIEAATSIFAGHDVRMISNKDAENLGEASDRLLALISEARERRRRYLLMLTGVPGSGKTLAGLHVVHSAVATGLENEGDIVYLSGNTPLVVVLREALAQDEHRRTRASGRPNKIGAIRDVARARIQHINDFLKESLRGSADAPPHEHVIVFDEAQRAWDEQHGFEKFERSASEPKMLLDLMSRHPGWCVCICLIGTGQEINSGEDGVFGWGEALRNMDEAQRKAWTVHGPPSIFGSSPTPSTVLGALHPDLDVHSDAALELRVPQRSYRSPNLSQWVDEMLAGNSKGAVRIIGRLDKYPILITRSIERAKHWLRQTARGERRIGLLASSGARRLRAEGYGVTLNATAGMEIAHWYLNPIGDVRSSGALEVPANEYTCQGLELDFACLCWGGDLMWQSDDQQWKFSQFAGTTWSRVGKAAKQQFLLNSYRVLLTRAREALIIWVPQGDSSDETRLPGPLDATAQFLQDCGAKALD